MLPAKAVSRSSRHWERVMQAACCASSRGEKFCTAASFPWMQASMAPCMLRTLGMAPACAPAG